MKKSILFLFLILFFSLVGEVNANIVINEIMYDLDGTDTNREWIEIKNDGGSSVDVSSYKFFEANTNHSLIAIGDSLLPSGSYAVIVQNETAFKADWPNYNGLIFDSTFSLGNETGELLGIKDPTDTIIDQITYTGDSTGENAGKSLQKNVSDWVVAMPTPGEDNNTNTSENGATSNTITETKKEEKVTEIPIMTAEIISPATVILFTEITFLALVNNYDGSPINYGKFVWNFGDGVEKILEKNEKVTHQYKYEGEYVVTLEFHRNYYLNNPDVVFSKTINAISADVIIASVDSEGSIILKNNSTNDRNISGFVISGSIHEYIVPKNTIIKANKTLTIVSDVLFFNEEEKKSLALLYPTRKIASSLEDIDAPKNKVSSLVVKRTESSSILNKEIKPKEILASAGEVISQFTNEAEAYENIPTEKNKKSSWWMYVLLLIGVIAIAIYGVNFIRRKSIDIDDDESIKDIKIVE